MHEGNVWFYSVSVVIAAACFAALGAQAAESTFPPSGSESGSAWTPAQPAQPAQPSAPSVSNDKFKQLRTRCETEVPSGKASGDICADAAELLVGADLPDEFRDMNEEQRVKIALRLLERGVDTSNLARGRAYDWYNRVGFLGVNAFFDAYRARELMDMMVKSGYPGATLRKIRSSTSILSIMSTDADKREGCATAKKLLNEGKLDVDSAKIARDILEGTVCTGFEQPNK